MPEDISVSSFCNIGWMVRAIRQGGWGLTVLFFVSGIQKKMTTDWMPHHMVKIMYVRQPILSIATGQANWFSMPASFHQ
jgi:hypothetical protein